MSWFIQTFRSSLGKKYIMALTGLLLGGFLLVHTIGNSTIFWGRSAFNAYAHHLHSLGVLVPIFEICLYTIFFLHVITGCLLWLQNRKARGGKYEMLVNAGGRTIGSKTMIYTGAAIFVFILIHLVNFHFPVKTETKTISDFVTQVLNNPFFTLIYTAGICLLYPPQPWFLVTASDLRNQSCEIRPATSCHSLGSGRDHGRCVFVDHLPYGYLSKSIALIFHLLEASEDPAA